MVVHCIDKFSILLIVSICISHFETRIKKANVIGSLIINDQITYFQILHYLFISLLYMLWWFTKCSIVENLSIPKVQIFNAPSH